MGKKFFVESANGNVTQFITLQVYFRLRTIIVIILKKHKLRNAFCIIIIIPKKFVGN